MGRWLTWVHGWLQNRKLRSMGPWALWVVGNEKADRLDNGGTRGVRATHYSAPKKVSRKNGIKKMAGGKGHETG